MNIRENLGLLYAIMDCSSRSCDNCVLQDKCRIIDSKSLRKELFDALRADVMEVQNVQER